MTSSDQSTLMPIREQQDGSREKRRYPRTALAAGAILRLGLFKGSRLVRVVDASPTGIGFDPPLNLPKAKGKVVVRWSVPPALSHERKPRIHNLRGEWVNGRAIRFTGLIHDQIEERKNRLHKFMVALSALLLVGIILALKSRNVISFWYQPLFQVYSLAASVFVITRIGLSAFYREPRDRGHMPRISVIIAAKNEEENIAKTIHHIFRSRYPSDRYEVLAIDDGSTDGTWAAMERMQERYPQLRCFRFEKNLGKRHGMAKGATEASGDILVFLDSDSLVEPEALYRIVQPFADPGVGAVAGHTLAIPEEGNFISKMEAVRYYVSQRVMKAAESIFGTVTCCPGPLSAYRRDAVMHILPAWLNQMFLGEPATFGDDRSLTNYILRRYRVLYHAGARCSTFVPGRWRVFVRQQLRWKKSWIREAPIASRIMLNKPLPAALSYYLSVIVTLASPWVVLFTFFYAPLVLSSHQYLPYVAGLSLVSLLLGLVYYYYTRARHWYYGLAFAVAYACFFSIQTYYALFTARQNHWGTR